jgi:hypothetical protein
MSSAACHTANMSDQAVFCGDVLKAKRMSAGYGGRHTPAVAADPSRELPPPDEGGEVRTVQPYQARKPYLCPGCNQGIGVGVGHLVVVPPDDPGLRRHWHRACWANRHRRRPGPG